VIEGNTPLHHAAKAGAIEAARLLLASGALPNVKNHVGSTALHLTTDITVKFIYWVPM
jgi:ankyrin repeat protein